MKIYKSIDEVPKISNLVLTQGTFDGVHIGHAKVLQTVVSTAAEKNGQSMLLTFFPHPRLVLYPNDNNLQLLSTLDEKIEQIASLGIDHLLVLPFTDAVAKLSPLEFVRGFLVDKLNVDTVIVGYDHRFGKNREGCFEDLVAFGEMFNFSVIEIPASEIEHIAISSTRIRKALLSGELDQANALLNRPYSIEGKVVHGKKIGRTIGFPTANIEVKDPFKLIPCHGVYAVVCHIGVEKYKGAANIGQNPTIEGKGFSVEVFIFDFNREIYDIAIRLELISFIRTEQKFENVEELKEKIKQDVHAAQAALFAY